MKIKYKMSKSGFCLTFCKYKKGTHVNSMECIGCEFFRGVDENEEAVYCSKVDELLIWNKEQNGCLKATRYFETTNNSVLSTHYFIYKNMEHFDLYIQNNKNVDSNNSMFICTIGTIEQAQNIAEVINNSSI